MYILCFFADLKDCFRGRYPQLLGFAVLDSIWLQNALKSLVSIISINNGIDKFLHLLLRRTPLETLVFFSDTRTGSF